MLRYIGEIEAANKIENAISFVLKEGKARTQDLGGMYGTQEFTDYIIAKM